MVKQKRSWQKWWQLYALALLMVGLLILVHTLASPPGWRTFLDSGVIIIGYGLITMWLETHSTALLREPPTDLSIQILESSPAEFHGSGPTIIYGMPEFPADHLGSNGHRPAQTIPFFPEDISNN